MILISFVRSLTLKKLCFLERGWNTAFLATFNSIISRTFLETFIEIPQVVQKIWSFFSLVLAIFIIFPCRKWRQHITGDVSNFDLQPALNSFFSNCIGFYWNWISFSWNMNGREEGGVKLTPLPSQRKNYLKRAKSY